MTTAAEKSRVLADSGQSIIEFLITLPLLVGLAILMVRMNTAIQISINNQQIARSHALWLAFNSPNYPQKRYYSRTNRMVIGVSENTSPKPGEEDFIPYAQTQTITRTVSGGVNRGPAAAEPAQRDEVRLRTTVALCTPSHVVYSKGSLVDYGPGVLQEGEAPASFFAYCAGPDPDSEGP